MAENSNIQWTDHTFNPWIGCTKVSNGCKFCYAEALMEKHYKKCEWGPKGKRVRTSAENWEKPRRWARGARKAGGRKPRVFCASLADVCEDNKQLKLWRDDLICLIMETYDALDWQLLSKRPENYVRMFPPGVLERCSIGTSVEDQQTMDERAPALLTTPARIRFISHEPLLGPIAVERAAWSHAVDIDLYVTGQAIDWAIIGGESVNMGGGGRHFQIEFARYIINEYQKGGVPVFVKQLGHNPVEYVRQGAWGHNPILDCPMPAESGDFFLELLSKKGDDPNEWPKDLRVREFPEPVEVGA